MLISCSGQSVSMSVEECTTLVIVYVKWVYGGCTIVSVDLRMLMPCISSPSATSVVWELNTMKPRQLNCIAMQRLVARSMRNTTWLSSLSTASEVQCVICPMRWLSHGLSVCFTTLGCLLWARPWRYSVSYVPCVECPVDSLSVLLHLAAFFEHGLGGTVCRMSHALSVPWTLCLFYYTWLSSLSTALEIQCVVCPMRWVSHPVLCLFH